MLLIIDIIFVLITLFLIYHYIISENIKSEISSIVFRTSGKMIKTIPGVIVAIIALTLLIFLALFNKASPTPNLVERVEIEHLMIRLTPDRPQRLEINTPYVLSATLFSPDGTKPLSQLVGYYFGNNASLQNLLGVGNTSCISATLEFDSDQVKVAPSDPQDYPLNQSNITWRWLVTPKQANQQEILLNFQIAGETHCGGEVVTGPYPLAGNYNYSFTVVDPNENPIISILKRIDVGGAITAALGTVLASLCIWIGKNIILKRGRTRLSEVPAKRPQRKKRRTRR